MKTRRDNSMVAHIGDINISSLSDQQLGQSHIKVYDPAYASRLSVRLLKSGNFKPTVRMSEVAAYIESRRVTEVKIKKKNKKVETRVRTAEGVCGVSVDLSNSDLRKIDEARLGIKKAYEIRQKVKELRQERNSTSDETEKAQFNQSIDSMREELHDLMEKEFPRYLADLISLVDLILHDWNIAETVYKTNENLVETFNIDPYIH